MTNFNDDETSNCDDKIEWQLVCATDGTPLYRKPKQFPAYFSTAEAYKKRLKEYAEKQKGQNQMFNKQIKRSILWASALVFVGFISFYTIETRRRLTELEQWQEQIYIHIPAMEPCDPNDWNCEPDDEDDEYDADQF